MEERCGYLARLADVLEERMEQWVPLVQADFLHRRLRTDYKDIHYFVWTDAITGAEGDAATGFAKPYLGPD